MVSPLQQSSVNETRDDASLLQRFWREGDQHAFAMLVHRYGPMVLGTCQRVTKNHAISEEAFQATFMVLLQQRPSLQLKSLAPWLHGVARRIALKAIQSEARRRRREARAASHELVSLPDRADVDLLAKLDEEVASLPDHYRLAVLFCDLQGLSRQIAAERLGIPQGTLSSRLAEARKRLRDRLSSTIQGTPLVVPASLLVATVSQAGSPLVQTLAREMVRTMSISSLLRSALVIIGVASCIALGTVALRAFPSQPRPTNEAPVVTPITANDPHFFWRSPHVITLPFESKNVPYLAFTPDQQFLVFRTSWDTVPRVWSTENQKLIPVRLDADKYQFVGIRSDGKALWYRKSRDTQDGISYELQASTLTGENIQIIGEIPARPINTSSGCNFAYGIEAKRPRPKDEKEYPDNHYVINLNTGESTRLPKPLYHRHSISDDGKTIFLGTGTDYAIKQELGGEIQTYDVASGQILWDRKKFSSRIPSQLLNAGSLLMVNQRDDKGLVGPVLLETKTGRAYFPPGWNIRSPIAEFNPENALNSHGIGISTDAKWLASVISKNNGKLAELRVMHMDLRLSKTLSETLPMRLEPYEDIFSDALIAISPNCKFLAVTAITRRPLSEVGAKDRSTATEIGKDGRLVLCEQRLYLWAREDLKSGLAVDAVPPLLREALSPTPIILAEAANRLISMGEEMAYHSLDSFLVDCMKNSSGINGQMIRTAWLCRMLYEPKNAEPLRQPLFGALGMVPYQSMPLKEWPQYPLIRWGDCYFALGESYTLFGLPENPREYLEYSRTQGKFRTTLLPVPNKEEIKTQLNLFLQSPLWKSLKWKDAGNGWSYEMSPDTLMKYLSKQAE